MNKSIDYLKNLIKENDTIVVACSGGPDSICLATILIELQKKIKFKIVVAHLNHNVRKEAKAEEEFVKKFCLDNNIIFESSLLLPITTNFECLAREKRYNFLEEVVKKYQANYLMTAHHGDDLMETILMRLTRGSSLKGYRGFDLCTIKNNYQVIRPLIFTTKQEIIEYLETRKIKYCLDQSNNDLNHTRNRYRHLMLPFLKKEEKDVHLKFIDFHNTLKEAESYIERRINQIFLSVYHNNIFNLDAFNTFDSYEQKRLLIKLFSSIYIDDLYLITSKHLKELEKIIRSNKPNLVLNLPNNHSITKSYQKLYIDQKNANDFLYQELKEINKYHNQIIEIVEDTSDNSNYITRLNSKEINLPLYIRTMKSTDLVEVKNFKGHQKLKKIFTDLKINSYDREKWLILVDSQDNVIWVPGLKKTKFDKAITEKYDIILRYIKKKEK